MIEFNMQIELVISDRDLFFSSKKTIGEKHNKKELHDRQKKERKNQNRIIVL